MSTSLNALTILWLCLTLTTCLFGNSKSLNQEQIQSQLGKHFDTAPPLEHRDNGIVVLRAALQNIEAWIGPDGLEVHSTSENEARGSFALHPIHYGRTDGTKQWIKKGLVAQYGKQVILQREGFFEEFSVSQSGLRQDFVIDQSPLGSGELRLELQLQGAQILRNEGDGILLSLNGRELIYSQLKVFDANGTLIPARMEKINSTDVVIQIDDRHAKYPIRIDPTLSDADWYSIGLENEPLFNGIVRDVAFYQNEMIIGGEFTNAAGIAAADHIVKWDGCQWLAMGDGVNNDVNEIEIGPGGNIYIGGTFTNASGNALADRIAYWDGNDWRAMGSGLNDTVTALKISDDGMVYVGGKFTNAGGIGKADRIAKWDGQNWSNLGSNGSADPLQGASTYVYSIALDGNDVYVAGDFHGAGGDGKADRVARFDGTTWHVVGSESGSNGDFASEYYGGSSAIYALAVHQGKIYVGGHFANLMGDGLNDFLVYWDGSNWQHLGDYAGNGAIRDDVLDIEISPSGNIYVGGRFINAGGIDAADYAAVWNGISWEAIGNEGTFNNHVRNLTIRNGELYVSGEFTNTAGNSSLDYFTLTNVEPPSITLSHTECKLDFTINEYTQLILSSANISASSPKGLPLNWSLSSQPSHGNIILTISGNFIDSLVYTPYLDYQGEDQFVIQVSDGNTSAWTKVQVTTVDVPIVLTFSESSPLSYQIFEDSNLSLASANISASENSGLLQLSWSLSSNASQGNVTSFSVSGNELTSLVYTPNPNASGNDMFQVQVSAGELSETMTVNVTIIEVNDLPAIAEGNTLSISMDKGTIYNDFSISASDVDVSQILTWSLSGNASQGTVSVSGNGLHPTISYTPNSTYFGPDQFVVQVSDGLATDSITIDVTIYDIPALRSTNLVMNSDWQGFGSQQVGPLSGQVNATAVMGGNLYVGGSFLSANGIAKADYIAKWDGTSWSAVGNGLNGVVTAIVVSGTDLIIGGSFTDAAGIPEADNIVRWNGSEWSALGDGLSQSVIDLAMTTNGIIYACGQFKDAGGDPNADFLAQFDGNTWSIVGSKPSTTVYSVVAHGNDLYAGGFFVNLAGIDDADYIAKWDGSEWHAVGAGITSGINDIVLWNDDVYVGGGFKDVGGDPNIDYFAKWDGNAWVSPGGITFNNRVEDLLLYNNILYVGGSFKDLAGISSADYVAKWDGNSWSAIHSGISSSVRDMLFFNNELYIAGSFTNAGSYAGDYLVKYDGQNWASLGQLQDGGVFNGAVHQISTVNNQIFAIGAFTGLQHTYADHVAYWNDNKWNRIGTDDLNQGKVVYSMANSGNQLYLGGYFYNGGSNFDNDNFVMIDLDNDVPNGFGAAIASGTGGHDNSDVHSVVLDGSKIYLGGDFSELGGVSGTAKIGYYDGSAWHAMAPGLNGRVNTMILHNGDLYVGGDFIDAGGVAEADHLAKWDGTAWSAVGTHLNGPVHTMVISNGNLIVGGEFHDVAGLSGADSIASWDGNSWSAFARGLSGSTYAITFSDQHMYVGGHYNDLGDGGKDVYLARWDGSTWQALDAEGSFSDTVYALLIKNDILYVGGAFENAGLNGSNDFFTALPLSAIGSPVLSVYPGPEASFSLNEDNTLSLSSSDLSAEDRNGTVLSWTLSTNPSHGSVEIMIQGNTIQTLVYTPTSNFYGSDNFVLTVSNGSDAETITVSANVHSINDVPVISPDGSSQTIMIQNGIWSAPTITASDLEDDTLTWSLETQASNGTATASGTGEHPILNYSANSGFSGIDSFVIRVSDGVDSTTHTVLVTVNIIDAPSIAQGINVSVSMLEDGVWNPPSLSASDINGDTLTWSLATPASHGSASVYGTGSSPTIHYTPQHNYNGQDSFTVQVTDGTYFAKTTIVVAISPINDMPIIIQGNSLTVNMLEDGTWVMPELSASDADGDILTWTLKQSPNHGIAKASGQGSIPNLNYTPTLNYSGSDFFEIQVSDGQASVSITINITLKAVNDVPVILNGETLIIEMNEDGEWEAPSLSAEDADGDTLIWSIVTPSSNGTLSISGDGKSPLLNYQPQANFNGSDNFILLVSDGQSSDTLAIDVNIISVNDTPVVVLGEQVATTLNDGIIWRAPIIQATDADVDDVLTWSLATGSANGIVSVSGTGPSPEMTYFPNAHFYGDDHFSLQVSDGTENVVLNIGIVVNPAGAPYITQGSNISVAMEEDGEWVSPLIEATDSEGDTLVWTLASAAKYGTAMVTGIGASPIVKYSPNANYHGIDSFQLKVSDGTYYSLITLDLTISARNDAPIIAQGDRITTYMLEDGQFSTPTLLGSDIDGDKITWSLLSNGTLGNAQVSGTGANPNMSYIPQAGVHGSDNFIVQLSDGQLSDNILIQIEIDSVNDQPSIDQGSEISVTMDEDGTWSSPSLSATDVDNDTLTWSLLTAARHGKASVTGTVTPTWSYYPEDHFHGTDSFVIQVSDDSSTDSILVKITVLSVPDAPVITQGDALNLSMLLGASWPTPTLVASDADGDALTWSISNASPNGNVSVSGTGGTPILIYQPYTGFTGSDSFTLQVSDGTLSDSIVIQTTILPLGGPVIAQGSRVSVVMDEDGTWTSPSISASDADGDTLTWSLESPARSGAASVSGIGSTPTLQYQPLANRHGSDSFQAKVSDGTYEALIFVDVTINPINDAPVIEQGSSLSVSMKEDGSFSPPALSATDVDGDQLSWSLQSPASHGIATVSGSGSVPTITYLANSNFSGSDSFVVVVSDGTLTNSATININVASINDAPISAQGSSIVVYMDEDGVWTAPEINVIDADGDVLTWSLTQAASHGEVAVNSNGSNLLYSPHNDYAGYDSFVLSVSDGLTSISITINVTIIQINDTPIVNSSAITTAAIGLQYRTIISAEDPENSALSYFLESGPAGMTVDSVTGSVIWTPTIGSTSKYESVVIVISDGSLSTRYEYKILVDGLNSAPIIAQGALTYAYAVGENFTTPTIFATDRDEDDTLTWLLLRQAQHGIATVSGTGAAPNITYIPTIDYSGEDSFVVQVQDDTFTVDSITVKVTVSLASEPLIITSLPVSNAKVDVSYHYEVMAVSLTNRRLTYSLETAPEGMTIHSSTGVIDWTPQRNNTQELESVRVTVRDGINTYTQSYTISIPLINSSPVIAGTGIFQVEMNEDSVFNAPSIVASDSDPDDVLVWSLSEGPSHGDALVNGFGETPSIVYVPHTNFSGIDEFIVKVTDSYGKSAQAMISVTINGVNDAPTIRPSTRLLVNLPKGEELLLQARDIGVVDLDGDALTWTLSSNAKFGTIRKFSISDNGQINELIYTPPEGFGGTDEFTLEVNDGQLSDIIVIKVRVGPPNELPIIAEGEQITVHMQEDESFVPPVLHASDIEMDDAFLIWSISSAASHGQATVFETGSSPYIDYSPAENYNGTDRFTLRVTDNYGGYTSTEVVVHISPVNDAPLVIAPVPQNLSVGDAVDFRFLASDVEEDTLQLQLIDTAYSWLRVNASTLRVTGTVPAYESGQNLNLRFGVSDGQELSIAVATINVASQNNLEPPLVNLTSETIQLNIYNNNRLALKNAEVWIPGRPRKYSDNNGQVDMLLVRGLKTSVFISADGYVPQTVVIDGLKSSPEVQLAKAELLISGTVNLANSASPRGVQVIAMSTAGRFKTEVKSDGSYSLFLPKGAAFWTIGATFSGYGDKLVSVISQADSTAFTQNFYLVEQSLFSWRSKQSSSTSPIGVWLSAEPVFAAGEEANMVFTALGGNVGNASFESDSQEVYLEISPESGVQSVTLSLAIRSQTFKSQFDVLNANSPVPNPYVLQRVSHLAGTKSKVSLLPPDSNEQDPSGFEIPPFGVTENVEAIRAERYQSSGTIQQKMGTQLPSTSMRLKNGLRDGAKIYRIDAYGIDPNTGTLIQQGNDQIDSIYLTLSYDPNSWNPTLNEVVYSEDEGLTWQKVSRDDIVSIDTERSTVTIVTSHLSLWSASLLESESISSEAVGIPSSSVGSSAGGGGGGCLLKTSYTKINNSNRR